MPGWLKLSELKPATPFESVRAVVVPPRVPPPPLKAMETLTETPATGTPAAFSARTETGGEIGTFGATQFGEGFPKQGAGSATKIRAAAPSGGAMFSVNSWVAACWGLLESVTRTVKTKVPAVEGVPLIKPAGESVRFEGEPLTRLQVSGAVPPLANS